MLVMPRLSASTFTMLSIDPGSDCLGLACFEVAFGSYEIVSVKARTLVGTKMLGKDTWAEEIHGNRLARIRVLEETLLRIFNMEEPVFIVSEAPFINMRRPQAYGALTEVICAIRNAVFNYDPWKKLLLIDPPTVKKAVGAPGNAGKDDVKLHLLKFSGLNYSGDTSLADLDEHSIDAICVGLAHRKTLLETSK